MLKLKRLTLSTLRASDRICGCGAMGRTKASTQVGKSRGLGGMILLVAIRDRDKGSGLVKHQTSVIQYTLVARVLPTHCCSSTFVEFKPGSGDKSAQSFLIVRLTSHSTVPPPLFTYAVTCPVTFQRPVVVVLLFFHSSCSP